MRKAIFPGSFDPITLGHEDIIKRGVSLFDEIVIAIGVNAEKKYMFPLEERKRFVEETFKNEPKVKVITYEGLTIDLCHNIKADFILRGLRIWLAGTSPPMRGPQTLKSRARPSGSGAGGACSRPRRSRGSSGPRWRGR